MNGYFITGTDTGVGKTVVTALLATMMLKQGRSVCVYKPVQTGAEDCLEPDDPVQVEAWVRLWTEEDLPQSRFRTFASSVFSPPAAPLVASEGTQAPYIALEKLVSDFESLQRQYDVILVEGAGGLRVPITVCPATGKILDTLDLIEALGLPTLLVARPSLGTINHTLLSVEALAARQLTLAGVVISGWNPNSPDIAEQTLPDILVRSLTNQTPLLLLPYLDSLSAQTSHKLGSLAEVESILGSLYNCL